MSINPDDPKAFYSIYVIVTTKVLDDSSLYQ